MATYPISGQFGQGIGNPQFGGKNMATQRLTPNWSAGLGGNPWLSELQNVMKQLGFNYGNMTAGSGSNPSTGGLPQNTFNWLANATAGGGGTPLPVNARLTDTTAALNAALPGIYEKQTKSFGNAAKRFGQTGMLASQPYMEALGGVSRNTTNDIANLTQNLTFQANESAAQRGLSADLATQADQLARDLANRSRLMTAAGWSLDNSNADSAKNLEAANLLGDWYMRMREGDENRTLSYAGMPQQDGRGSGAIGNLMSMFSGAAPTSPYDDIMQARLRRKGYQDQLNQARGASPAESPLERKRRMLEDMQLDEALRGPQKSNLDRLLEELQGKLVKNQMADADYYAATGKQRGAAEPSELQRLQDYLAQLMVQYGIDTGPWADYNRMKNYTGRP